jgi:type III secretory pathway component EscU
MFDKVIFNIVMGTHIFNFGGSLAIVFKSFKCETIDPTSNKGSKLQLDLSSMIELCKVTHPMKILLIMVMSHYLLGF